MKSDRSKVLMVGLLYALTLILMVCATLFPGVGQAAPAKSARQALADKLSTRMSFSGSRVGGQYQIPAEATAKVENEKPIEELLGLRTQFRDRMKQDEERK